MQLIDSHCHLADEAFAEDLEAVVGRARHAGVLSALCIVAADDAAEAARVQRLGTLWPEIRVSIGVHPHQAHRFEGRAADAIDCVRRRLTELPAARAVGEIGLDYHYDFSPPPIQRDLFRAQIALAREVRLPLVVHTREADADTIQLLKEEGQSDVAGVLHCFTGDADMARRALDLGLYVSFAGIVTFPRATQLRETARGIPADRLLVETDSPFLAPVPYRGKRNEPAWVARVIEVLADARGVHPEDLARLTTTNFHTLFRP